MLYNTFNFFSECGIGKYGINCQYKCGHCKEEFHCYHTDGSCLDGCAPGYKGPLCNICKYLYVS